jgi:hypothetical protein
VGEGDLTFKFTPSGDQVLVSWPLSASGSINEDRRPSPPPTPQTGRYAALYDLAWRPAWSLSGTVSTMPGMNPDRHFGGRPAWVAAAAGNLWAK